MTTISDVASTISITGMGDSFAARHTVKETAAGLTLIGLRITANGQQPRPVPRIRISWSLPMHDIYSIWHSGSDRNRNIPADWSRGNIAKVTSQMPVVSFYNYHGENRITAAFSDALEAVEIKAGVSEEAGELHCSLDLFVESSPELADYQATLRLDMRAIPFYTALDEVQQWWAQQPGYEPAPVPEPARLPMYSTWYSFHQQLEPAAIEAQCRLAKELGCEAVIVDDGWQTINNERGYAYCGDWEVATEKIPDMKAHVARVHDLGMKYVLWYSVPFVGQHSNAWTRFSDRMLYTTERLGAGVLDPRYPEVREYLIQLYEKALIEWDLDGFKLDFVDAFRAEPRFPQPATTPASTVTATEERDEQSIDKAVDRLLTDVMARLRKIKPDILIEFRQSYVGPLMRKYGNMFRAGDCPYEFITNRVRTLDIRLLCGQTAAHADMLMWHQNESAEVVAQQLINVLFAVPQISVMLDKLPPAHLEVVRYWLSFWRQHRNVLLDGKFMPTHPEVLYPLVSAATERQHLIVSYQNNVIEIPATLPEELIIINGSLEQRLVLEVTADSDPRQLHIRDCRGQSIQQGELTLSQGLHVLNVPAAGTVSLQTR